MSTSRIKLGHRRGEVYPNVWDDFRWISDHRKQLLETYGDGTVILVYEKQVVGSGRTIEEAEADAERGLSPEIEQITPVLHFVSYPYRLRRAVIRTEHKT